MATRYFALTELSPQPANAETYYNLMQRLFEVLAMHNVISATTTAQPGSPTDEDAYILPTGATGTNWAGNDNKLAFRLGSTWYFYTLAATWEGLTFYVQDLNYEVYWNGTAWNYVPSLSAEILTPSTTQTQAGGALLKRRITFAITGSGNDTYTLPGAILGLEFTLCNNTAVQLQVFPASGDEIDTLTVDVVFLVPAGPGKSVTFRARDTTFWQSAKSA